MKFRSYQLFFVAAVALLIAALCMPVMLFIEPSGATFSLSNFSMQLPDGDSSYVACSLGVVLIVALLVNLFALLVSLFQNFELQKRTSILAMLLSAGYYILLLVFSLLLNEGAEPYVQIATLLPFIALVLDMLALLAIRRAEANILARATGFRLRD